MGGCFLPWELIEAASSVQLPLVGRSGPAYIAFRVTDVDRVAATPRVRRGMVRRCQRIGWHWLCAPGLLTLSVEEMTGLVRYYVAHPGQRQTIGTQAVVEEIRAALSSVRPRAAR